MKHSPKPKRMEIGTCFICGEPCERYCHLKCAISFDSEKQRLIMNAEAGKQWRAWTGIKWTEAVKTTPNQDNQDNQVN